MAKDSVWTTLFVTIQVAPENRREFLDGLKISFDGVKAEPENVFYDLFEDLETPGLFRIVEVWTKDRRWMEEVQLKKTYYAPYLEKTQKLWIKERNIQIVERTPGFAFYKQEYLKASENAS